MLKLFFTFLLIGFWMKSQSQIKALTENGKEVILYENNTWKYLSDSTSEIENTVDSLKVNPIKFSKSPGSNFLVKSKNVNIGIYINPNKWAFLPHGDNEVNPEFRFSFKPSEAFALLISEKTEISLDNMAQIALINAQRASLDARIVKEEYRIVNNQKVLLLQINGTIKGIRFVYLGYYYSNENGTIQLITYTSEKLFNGLKKELEEFLNGFVVVKTK